MYRRSRRLVRSTRMVHARWFDGDVKRDDLSYTSENVVRALHSRFVSDKRTKIPFLFSNYFFPYTVDCQKKKKITIQIIERDDENVAPDRSHEQMKFFWIFFFCCFDKTEFSNICSQFYYLLSRRFRLFCSFPYHISNSSGLGDRILIYAISAETFLTLA